MLVHRFKNDRTFLFVVFTLLIVHNMFNHFQIKIHQIENSTIRDLIYKTNKSMHEGLHKYVEQCHNYPNEVIKSIVQSKETLKQISKKYELFRLESDGFFNGKLKNQFTNKLLILISFNTFQKTI